MGNIREISRNIREIWEIEGICGKYEENMKEYVGNMREISRNM